MARYGLVLRRLSKARSPSWPFVPADFGYQNESIENIVTGLTEPIWKASTGRTRSDNGYYWVEFGAAAMFTLPTRAFHNTMLDEFYRKAFRRKTYDLITALQTDFDVWLDQCNRPLALLKRRG